MSGSCPYFPETVSLPVRKSSSAAVSGSFVVGTVSHEISSASVVSRIYVDSVPLLCAECVASMASAMFIRYCAYYLFDCVRIDSYHGNSSMSRDWTPCICLVAVFVD